MKDLFIELHLDEDVDVLLAKLVRSRGFIAHTTQEAGCSGASDPEQLAYAASHGQTLLTHNRAHFTELAKYFFFNRSTSCQNHYCRSPTTPSNTTAIT